MGRLFVRASVVVATALAVTATSSDLQGQARTIGAFFEDFSAEWMRRRPSQSTQSRYFSGAEQDRLDRQFTPETAEWKRGTVIYLHPGIEIYRLRTQ